MKLRKGKYKRHFRASKMKPSSISASKGQAFPSAIGMTLVFMVLISVMAVIAVLVAAKLFLSDNSIAYKVEFLPLANKPFIYADVLGYAELGDRSFIEQAIQTAVTGSPEAAGAVNMVSDLKTLMKVYNPKQYKVTIKSGLDTVALVDSLGQKCGDNLEGWCVVNYPGCDVGYVEVDGKGACTKSQVCCRYNVVQYEAAGNKRGKYNVVRCGGTNNPGTCSEGATKSIDSFTAAKVATQIQLGPFCGDGQYELSDNSACKSGASIKTRLCCAEKTAEIPDSDALTTAFIPLLYKNTVGYVEVEVI